MIDVPQAEIWEDTGLTCLARIVGNSTTPIVKADVSSYTQKVFDEDSTSPNTALVTISVTGPTTDNIHALATDGRWKSDSIGFNFERVVHPSSVVFAKPNRRYRIEFAFTPSSTSIPTYKAVFRGVTAGMRGS
jgi:hypothetical protein